MTRSSWPARRIGGEEPDAEDGADEAAADQHSRELEVERVAPQGGERAGRRGGGDLRRLRADRDGRRNAEEDQERRHQEAAADAEQARDEADRRAHRRGSAAR